MKNKTTLFILLTLCLLRSIAQIAPITCSSERNADNSISIFADSYASGDYTIKVIFNSLAGYTANSILTDNVFLGTVTRGRKEIIKLKPDKSAGLFSFQYRYLYYPGKTLRKAPDSSLVYLLPGTAGNHIRISKVYSLSERLGQKSPDEFYATGFIYKIGDTICAARAGFINDCIDNVKEGEKAVESYKRSRNRIAIQHKDGSLGTYSILAPIKLLIAVGDYVFPGQPLAVFNTKSEKYQVLFSTYYLDEKKLFADNNDISTLSSPLYFVYMPTHFYTGENGRSILLNVNEEYMVQHPKEIIALEMNKKDRKKFGFQ